MPCHTRTQSRTDSSTAAGVALTPSSRATDVGTSSSTNSVSFASFFSSDARSTPRSTFSADVPARRACSKAAGSIRPHESSAEAESPMTNTDARSGRSPATRGTTERYTSSMVSVAASSCEASVIVSAPSTNRAARIGSALVCTAPFTGLNDLTSTSTCISASDEGCAASSSSEPDATPDEDGIEFPPPNRAMRAWRTSSGVRVDEEDEGGGRGGVALCGSGTDASGVEPEPESPPLPPRRARRACRISSGE
mmetsp:Transcript_27762/g.89393  ORF Transcript_27762/g.89393 Transcript_27762/m.89393 type:complete len:252 (-) Transcript_27762:4722-5477(-)